MMLYAAMTCYNFKCYFEKEDSKKKKVSDCTPNTLTEKKEM